jgi:hypothetical protein
VALFDKISLSSTSKMLARQTSIIYLLHPFAKIVKTQGYNKIRCWKKNTFPAQKASFKNNFLTFYLLSGARTAGYNIMFADRQSSQHYEPSIHIENLSSKE